MSEQLKWRALLKEETRKDRLNRKTTRTRAWVHQVGGNYIASVRSSHAKKAHLMAAAPELLRYCELFYSVLDEQEGRPGVTELRKKLGSLINDTKEKAGV